MTSTYRDPATRHLIISDTFNPAPLLEIISGAATIALSMADVDTGERITIAFGPDELDELAAEILRIRDTLGI